MAKWDYAVLTVDASGKVVGGMHGTPKPLFHALQEVGESGWDLVAAVTIQGGQQALYLKRQK